MPLIILRPDVRRKRRTITSMTKANYAKLLAYVNRKEWWHVPPSDRNAYRKRGKFLASTFREAEFYGRPLDRAERVCVKRPLIGDENLIARVLKIPAQRPGMSIRKISQHDAAWRNAALAKGYDSILLMARESFVTFKRTGQIPQSLELNLLLPQT